MTDWGGRPADEAKLRQYVPGEGGGEGVVESLIDTHYADTLDELADKLGIPAANLIASVERYNELAKSGVDVDFGKDQAYLKPSIPLRSGAVIAGFALLPPVVALP